MPGLRDIFSNLNDPLHRRKHSPLDVGSANDKNLRNFMNTDYSAFKDPQGNFTPSSLIGTAVPPLGTPPPATATLGAPVNTTSLPMPGVGRLPNMTPTALPPPNSGGMSPVSNDSFGNTFGGGGLSIARDSSFNPNTAGWNSASWGSPSGARSSMPFGMKSSVGIVYPEDVHG